MPQVIKKVESGWFKNVAKNAYGNPRPLTLGATMSFKPGQERFLRASVLTQSRATMQAFENALARGNLVEVKAGVEPEVEPVVEEPVVEPVVEEPEVEIREPAVEEPVAPPNRSELQSMNKAALVDMAKDMDIDDGGTKSEIIDRIIVSAE